MARKPNGFITISNSTNIGFGGQVMERAGYPEYLYAEWDQDRVTFYREEDYETKRQGIYKITWAGGVRGKGGMARISGRAIIEGAGLVDGRYVPISVDEDKIVLPLTPAQTPEEYSIQKSPKGES
jgi:hypothetical protein